MRARDHWVDRDRLSLDLRSEAGAIKLLKRDNDGNSLELKPQQQPGLTLGTSAVLLFEQPKKEGSGGRGQRKVRVDAARGQPVQRQHLKADRASCQSNLRSRERRKERHPRDVYHV